MLLDEHLFAFNGGNTVVNGPQLFVVLSAEVHRDLVVPQAHVGVGVVAIVHLIAGGDVHNGQVLGAERFQQTLHAWNDLVVNLVAGKGVAGPGPGVGQIHADQRRLFAETDTALKAVLLIQGGGFVESLVEHGHQILGLFGHGFSPFFAD